MEILQLCLNQVISRYDPNGRLQEVIQSTGERLTWPADFALRLLNEQKMRQNDRPGQFSTANPSYGLLVNERSDSPFSNQPSPSSFFLRLTGNNGSVSADVTHTVTDSGRFRRTLNMNDSALFSVELDPVTNDETVLKDDGTPVVVTKFDQVGRIVSVKPVVGVAASEFVESKFTYDDAGRLVKWEQGTQGKAMAYSDQGLPIAESSPNGAIWKFEYGDKRMPTKVTKGKNELHYSISLHSRTKPLILIHIRINFQNQSINQSIND